MQRGKRYSVSYFVDNSIASIFSIIILKVYFDQDIDTYMLLDYLNAESNTVLHYRT